MNIDMLDMLYKRMDGNLSEQEESYLSHVLSEIKMNYIEEKKLGDDLPEEEKEETDKPAEAKLESKEKPKPKEETKAKKPIGKKTTAKTKDKK